MRKIAPGGRGYDPEVASPQIVTLEGLAHGGEAVGRLPDGRVVFVAHAAPHETVAVEVTQERRRWARARLVDVVTPSVERVTPPCPYFGPDRCGGCALQHIDQPAQRRLLRQVVVDQLERLGGITDPPVSDVMAAGDYAYRSRARFGVTHAGALGYRRHASHSIIPIDRCLLLDEPTQALREAAGDDWRGAREIEVRTAPNGATVVADPLTAPRVVIGDATLTETVADLSYRVSASGFFQANRRGAGILVDLVRDGAGAGPGDTALDLYAGVGLFARALAADGVEVTAVEGHPGSVADAEANLAGLASVIHAPVEHTVARLHRDGRRFGVVVLDPPRRGAGADVVDHVAAIARRVIVIVACDAAALGRDAGVLRRAGWRLNRAVPVDQFAQTGHIEVVATFSPVGGDA